jgi:two-component system, sensor histidine kinase
MAIGRLLIVDDNRLDALDLHQRVTQLGHTVLAIAMSGEEALAQAAALRPDVVLMEIRLSGPVDGIQAGTQIWARFGIPVIYVSAHLPARTFQRLWPSCMAGLLGKHVGGRDLHRALGQALEHRVPIPSNRCAGADGSLWPHDRRHHQWLPLPGTSAGSSS